MADSDSDDFGWDASLDDDAQALLNAVAEQTAAAIDDSTTLAGPAPAVPYTPERPRNAIHVASSPPTLVPVPANALRNDALSQEYDRDAEGLDDLEIAAAGPDGPDGAPSTGRDAVYLVRRRGGTVCEQDVPHTHSPGHSRLAPLPTALYPDLSRVLADLGAELSGAGGSRARPPGTLASTSAVPDGHDARGPLLRFRTFPRKPLSVSDLTSGAWCEVQYEYTLTRLPGGRRTRTEAMRGGTRVHTRLEEEVHTTVQVDVATREDFLGLKMWNMVQGLRTLRETGLTRELEIWGVLPGYTMDREERGREDQGPQVVNGVIDALSYHCPDPAFEEMLETSATSATSPVLTPPPARSRTEAEHEDTIQDILNAESPVPTPRKRGRPRSGSAGSAVSAVSPTTPKKIKSPKVESSPGSAQKARITDFFASQTWPRTPKQEGASSTSAGADADADTDAGATTPRPPLKRIYITDIKTRGTDRLPSGAAVRPTKVQLFLYHRFLSDLAAGKLDFGIIFKRYRLDQDTAFSDSFLSQVGSMHEEIFNDTPDSSQATGASSASQGSEGSEGSDDYVPIPLNQLRYRTLRQLVGLLKEEVALTFPHGAHSVGNIVAVEYRMRARDRPRRAPAPAPPAHHADPDNPNQPRIGLDEPVVDESEHDSEDEPDPDAGRCIGTNVIPVDEGLLDRYLAWYMAWWRGQRPAVGVPMEEAGYKCRMCEFDEDCDWRIGKAEEHAQRMREKRKK